MSLPLEGIRVLELARIWAVPGAAMHLADQGAEVIKVEPPAGDDCRRAATLPLIAGESRAWWLINRNKRGIVVDTRTPEGLAVVQRLAEGADVLLHNYRPGVAERMGVGYEALRERNPRLIYLAFSAYGEQGPYRDARGYDLLIQAASGILGRRSMPDGSPRAAGLWAVDMASSMLVAYAVSLALLHRERTGEGQRVDGSLLNAALALQMTELIRAERHPDAPGAPDVGTQAVFGAYRCADGRHVQLAVVNDAEWGHLCEALGRPELRDDPRFATYVARAEHSEALREVLRAGFAERAAEAWETRFREHDVPGMVVLHPEEVLEHEQTAANGAFVDVEQPGVGPARMMGLPFRLHAASGHRFTPAPAMGEHTDAVLREAGYAADEIARLRKAGVVK